MKAKKRPTNNQYKKYMAKVLDALKTEVIAEYRFAPPRLFRFDYAIPSHRIAIEYEGIYGGKSRHTSVVGYTNDTEKYNLAAIEGWRVLRYTAKTVTRLKEDLEALGIR